jgi:hypothetical protein
MGKAVSVELDERLERFIDHVQQSKQLPPTQISAELMRAGYHDLVRRLHRQYLDGEITLRAMAKELGLEYRELYALLEDLNLAIA